MRFPTVADIKVMLNIDPSDTSKDVLIQMQLDVVLAILENYCDRRFPLAVYQERFLPFDARNPSLLLRARPVEEVSEVERSGQVVDAGQYKVYPEAGIVRQANANCCWCGCETDDVLVTYRGGWDTDEWPADFIDVVLQLFMQRWNATGGTGSYTDTTGAAGSGKIKAFTVDAVRVEYDLGGGGSSGKSVGGGVPPELAPFAAILAKYCDLQAYGV
jgi:hypothetical protein